MKNRELIQVNKPVRRVVTIRDVAREAGVSKTTISHYLNGKYEYMSAETRERIKNIITISNYRPNKLASGLKSNRSRQIGVLIADICNPISAILVRGISDVCEAKGYSILIYCTDSDLQRERNHVENLIDQRVEGILVNPADYDHSYEVFANKSVPIVMMECSVNAPVDTVLIDSRSITGKTLEHLYQEGFRSLFLFTEEPKGISTRRERVEIFKEFYRGHFTEGAERAIVVMDAQEPGRVEEAVRNIACSRAKGVPAIFTTNGVCLLSVLKAVKHLKLRIPEDIALCGYDDWSWAELVSPGITAIAQPTYQVGEEAARLLLSRIEGGPDAASENPVCHMLHATLHIRESTRFPE